jgi:hypothetical protein
VYWDTYTTAGNQTTTIAKALLVWECVVDSLVRVFLLYGFGAVGIFNGGVEEG